MLYLCPLSGNEQYTFSISDFWWCQGYHRANCRFSESFISIFNLRLAANWLRSEVGFDSVPWDEQHQHKQHISSSKPRTTKTAAITKTRTTAIQVHSSKLLWQVSVTANITTLMLCLAILLFGIVRNVIILRHLSGTRLFLRDDKLLTVDWLDCDFARIFSAKVVHLLQLSTQFRGVRVKARDLGNRESVFMFQAIFGYFVVLLGPMDTLAEVTKLEARFCRGNNCHCLSQKGSRRNRITPYTIQHGGSVGSSFLSGVNADFFIGSSK